MLDNFITIDFETHDPYIARGVGSGWVYGINIPDSDFEILGAAIRLPDGEMFYETNHDKILDIAFTYDGYIMHNAAYDLGCLQYLCNHNDKLLNDLRNKQIIDTYVMSCFHNSNEFDRRLDTLGRIYLGQTKVEDELGLATWKHGLYQLDKKRRTGQNCNKKPTAKILNKFAKTVMKDLQRLEYNLIALYAIQDVNLTYGLYDDYKNKVNMELVKKYSGLAHICNSYRTQGVRIDLEKAREVHCILLQKRKELDNKVYELAGEEFNYRSSVSLPKIFDKMGIKYIINPPTDKDLKRIKMLEERIEDLQNLRDDKISFININSQIITCEEKEYISMCITVTLKAIQKLKAGRPSITKDWLEEQTHPLCKAIVMARKYTNIDNNFIKKIIDMQQWTCPNAEKYGRVYPELNLLRARTGRFSCSNPNIQQIPSRDTELAPLCRSLFVAEEGTNLYSLDYSNQEGRLQVHYAYKLNCEGAAELKLEFDKNPLLDMHQKVADMANIDRTSAKAINLGISYGMGIKKLAKALNLSNEQAKYLINQYNNFTPFLKDLNDKCKKAIKLKGFIYTLMRRPSHLDNPLLKNGERKTFEYKALNKLIQGSAADQIIEAMIHAYNEGLHVLFPIHDQILMCGTREQAMRMKEIMETCCDLEVPVVVDVNLNGGFSWAEAGH